MVDSISVKVEIDKRTFATYLNYIETKIASYDSLEVNDVNNAQKAILHALCGYLYDNARRVYYVDIDDWRTKGRNHWNQMLMQKLSLSRQKATDYKALFTINEGSEIFEHDLLHSLLEFMAANASLWEGERYVKDSVVARQIALYKECADFYKSINRNAAYEYLMQKCDFILLTNSCPEERSDALLHYRNYVKSHPETMFKDEINQIEKNLLCPKVLFRSKPFGYAGQPITCNVDYWNSDSASIRVYQYKGDAEFETLKIKRDTLDSDCFVTVYSHTFVLGRDTANIHRLAMGLPVAGKDSVMFSLPAGEYVFECISSAGTDIEKHVVRSLAMIGFPYSPTKYCAVVMDPRTGMSQPGVKVEYEMDWDDDDSDSEGEKCGVKRTNKYGEAFFHVKKDWELYLTASKSKCDYVNLYPDSYYNENDEEDVSATCFFNAFTDRKIYRHGQTIKVSGIFSKGNWRDDYKVIKGFKTRIGLYSNVTDSILVDKEIVTNEYGSFDVELPVPRNANVGSYEIRCLDADIKRPCNYCEIRVEEYKCPTWKLSLEFDSLCKAPVFGATIMVRGSAMTYTDVPARKAKLSYEITRSYNYYSDKKTCLCRDNATIHDDGSFSIPFVLLDSIDKREDFYRLTVAVSDEAGEVHEGSIALRLLGDEFDIRMDNDQVIDLNSERCLRVRAFDALNRRMDVDVYYDLMFHGKTVGKGVFNTNNNILLSSIYEGNKDDMPMGDYVLKMMAYDRLGNKINRRMKLRVFDSNPSTCDRRAIDFDEDFLFIPNRTFVNGVLNVYFVPKSDSCYVRQIVSTCLTPIVNRRDVYNRKLNHIQIRYDRAMGDAAEYILFYFRDYKLYSHGKTIGVAEKDKHLKLELKSFRDKVTPGNKEKWVVNVASKDGRSRGVELLASMYDASLEGFGKHKWYVYLPYKNSLQKYYHDIEAENIRDGVYSCLAVKSNKIDNSFRKFDVANVYAPAVVKRYQREFSAGCQTSGYGMKIRGLSTLDEEHVLKEVVINRHDMKPGDMQDSTAVASEDSPANTDAIVRNNFEETAFFYPHLVSDANGDVNIEFTLPESLTSWNFMCLAHDKSMNYGIMCDSVIASKSFMVQSALPRFIRSGDETLLSARVINENEDSVSASVTMRLFRASDDSLVYTASQSCSVAPHSTYNVHFPYTAVSADDDLICEIIAEADDVNRNTNGNKGKVSKLSTINSQHYSDGERNFLPVLPSRMMMKESVPFILDGNEDKDISLECLENFHSTTAEDKTLSIEYCSSPAWMAIDALRGVRKTECACATCLASSAYASYKLVEIAKQLEKLTGKKICDVDEAERNYSEMLDKLNNLKDYNGSLKWLPGMDGASFGVTLVVAEQLSKISSKPRILGSLLGYLDKAQLKKYENACANGRLTLSEADYHYLNVCALNREHNTDKNVKAMQEVMLDSIEANLNSLSIYGMASSANVLRAFGRTQSADYLLDILRQYLVYDEGLGKHFESNRAQYSWYDYRIPTQVAAMEALYTANPKDENLNDMTLWLLRQKQVQSWDNPTNTVNVCDLLLKMNETSFDSELMSHNSTLPRMTLNGKQLTDKSFVKDNVKRDSLYFAEEMGYMNKQVSPSLAGNAKTLKIQKNKGSKVQGTGVSSVSWGAVTVTFTEESNKLNSYTTGEVRISRRILVEDNSGLITQNSSLNRWRDLREGETLRVGQKVRVRHTLHTDRDMDYVRVKTLHPACFEPVDKLSGYQWKGGEGCYQSIHDSYIEMFFQTYHEGTSTLDIDYYVTRPGTYNMGITTAECTYAPMYGGHSNGMTVKAIKN